MRNSWSSDMTSDVTTCTSGSDSLPGLLFDSQRTTLLLAGGHPH